jgi:PelA/Pel-15E family pectate lyase
MDGLALRLLLTKRTKETENEKMRLKFGMRPVTLAAAVALLAGCAVAGAKTIGMNTPARSLTRERIAQLPKSEQKAWFDYLERSERQRAADKASFAAEVKAAGVTTPSEPAHGFGAYSLHRERAREWYASADAQRIADNVTTYQTPAGGWGKNMDMTREPRKLGERYAPNNVSRLLSPGDFDTPADPEWNYIGTIDNDATTTELNFLAKAIGAAGKADTAKWRASFAKGIEYLLQAQYPNGGWPQVWPLEGGYHDAITYNDDAVTQVIELMHSVAEAKGDFGFALPELRKKAAAAFERGIRCTLASQLREDGKRTGWAQQEDMLTLEPVSARNYEMPATSSGESAGVMRMLMVDLPHPTAEEQRAIHAVAAWFEKTAIYGESYERTPAGRGLVAKQGAGPIWARYYQMGTDKPIFGDRDKTIHDTVDELSLERRNGYGWYGTEPSRALEQYAQWKKQHPETK